MQESLKSFLHEILQPRTVALLCKSRNLCRAIGNCVAPFPKHARETAQIEP
jgi:hypothetical protein